MEGGEGSKEPVELWPQRLMGLGNCQQLPCAVLPPLVTGTPRSAWGWGLGMCIWGCGKAGRDRRDAPEHVCGRPICRKKQKQHFGSRWCRGCLDSPQENPCRPLPVWPGGVEQPCLDNAHLVAQEPRALGNVWIIIGTHHPGDTLPGKPVSTQVQRKMEQERGIRVSDANLLSDNDPRQACSSCA